MMTEKPSYEELQERVRELEAEKRDQSTQYEALNNLFNLSLDMLCVADFEGYFRVINSAFENILGHTRQVLLETPFIEFVHPDDQAATQEAVAQQAAGEPVAYFENRYRCKDGSYKWLAWTAVPASKNGYIYAVARDITKQKAIQCELEAQRELFNNVLSNVPASIFWKDRNSVYLGVNKQFARDTGLQSPDELIGKSDYDLAWTKEEADFYRECDLKVMDGGEAMLNIEESQLQADGRTVHLLTNKVPLLDAMGQVTGMLGIYMDITKRKQAETSLRKSESRLQTLFDSVVEYIFVIDPEGQIIKVNRYVYEQSGYKADEIIGRNIKEFFSEDSKVICDCNFPTLLEQGYNRAEVEFVCKDGRVIQMECSATAVPDENGDFTTFLIVQRDVTDEKRAEEERQYHHQEMAHVIRLSTAGEMASGMAHELNQPLTALLSYCGTAVSLVNSMSSPPQQLSDILERATEQAHRAGEIIRHLREFVSKGDNNQEFLDIDQVIRDVIIFIKHEVQESDVEITFHPGSQTCKIKANKIQIEQVLVNMVRNSLEAIRHAKITEGQIVLQSRSLSNELVKVTVADNGPGINPAMVDTLFHPFQTTKKTGMGIGLSLSRTIIETLGGKLWVDKDYENGALFAFELPVSK